MVRVTPRRRHGRARRRRPGRSQSAGLRGGPRSCRPPVAARPRTRRRRRPQHGAVVRHHLGDELRDACVRGRLGELLEQARADPSTLQVVRYREGDLGRGRVAQPDEVRERDDALPLAGQRQGPDQRATLFPVRVEKRLDRGRGQRGEAVEAPVDASLRQRAEEPEHRVGVARMGWAQAQRAPVPEDDVANLGRCECHPGQCGCPPPATPSDRPRNGLRQTTEHPPVTH